MQQLRILSAAEQVADHLRNGITEGTWECTMPGGDRLAGALGVGKETMEAALRQLEEEGLLIPQGRRKGRKIRPPEGGERKRKIRIAILLRHPDDKLLNYMVELRHQLDQAGHRPVYATLSTLEAQMEIKRIARTVGKTEADAWIVVNGDSQVLEWFSGYEKPSFALFGRSHGVPIAGVGPDKREAMAELMGDLFRHGHRRIVYLARPWNHAPGPGSSEQVFLDGLTSRGINPGAYNLPVWQESPAGFHARLESLFGATPPTALILDETVLFVAAQQFLLSRKLRVPEDVSLACTNNDPAYGWCRPELSRIAWDTETVVKRVKAWANSVAGGKQDIRQKLIPSVFIRGKTIGRAR